MASPSTSCRTFVSCSSGTSRLTSIGAACQGTFCSACSGGLYHSGRTGHRDDAGLGLLPGPSGVPAAVASFSCEYDRRSFVDASVGATGTASAKGQGGSTGQLRVPPSVLRALRLPKGQGVATGHLRVLRRCYVSPVGVTGTASAKGAGGGFTPSLHFPSD